MNAESRVYDRTTCRAELLAATRDTSRWFTVRQAMVWVDHAEHQVRVALNRLCDEGVLVRRQSGGTMYYRRPA